MSKFRIKIAIFFNFFLSAVLINSVSSVTLQVQHYFGVTKVTASVLGVIEGWTIAAVSFVIASYIIKIGYRKSMLIALGAMAAACFIIPAIRTYTAIEFLFVIIGAGFAFIKISIMGISGLISENDKEHISLMNFLESSFMIGVMSGYFIFSVFIDDHSFKSPYWFNVYYFIGCLYSVAFIWLLFTPINESAAKPISANTNKGELTKMLKLLALPAVGSFVIVAFLYVLLEQSIMEWLPTFNYDVLHIPSSFSIILASIMAASTAVGRFCAGFLLKRYSWLNVLRVCLVLTAVLVLIALPLAKNATIGVIKSWKDIPLAGYALPMVGFFLAPVYPVINSVILGSLPKNEHATMAGLIMVFSAIGGSCGAVITGFIFQHYGGQTAFYFSIFPASLLIIVLMIFKRRVAAIGISSSQ